MPAMTFMGYLLQDKALWPGSYKESHPKLSIRVGFLGLAPNKDTYFRLNPVTSTQGCSPCVSATATELVMTLSSPGIRNK